MAARVEHVAAGIVERQAEAEGDALSHLGRRLQPLFRRQKIDPPELIVGPEIAPVRALGPLGPTFVHNYPHPLPARTNDTVH